MDWRERLRKVVAAVFPPEARVLSIPGQADLVLVVSWRLGREPARPSKRSKTIHLTFQKTTLGQYADTAEADRRRVDERLQRALRAQLATFDPDHQTPVGREPPIVRWVIGGKETLGN